MTSQNIIEQAVSSYIEMYGLSCESIAVAVSGGADSMALCFALSCVFDGQIYAYTVDHGLRAEAAQEARFVHETLLALDNVTHEILVWDHDKSLDSRIQEQARSARYDLMFAAMKTQSAEHLFVGHHMDDQAETFLFRLAKGSGLDGLSCMQPLQPKNSVSLCRPLLTVSKVDILEYCMKEEIPFIDDPSNGNEAFARVRLRNSMSALEKEGMSVKRLSVTARRMARARRALENIARKSYNDAVLEYNSICIVFNYNLLIRNEEEVFLRIVLRAIDTLHGGDGYGTRREKVETLCEDLMKPIPFRKRTLGGVIFERDDKAAHLTLKKEH